MFICVCKFVFVRKSVFEGFNMSVLIYVCISVYGCVVCVLCACVGVYVCVWLGLVSLVRLGA